MSIVDSIRQQIEMEEAAIELLKEKLHYAYKWDLTLDIVHYQSLIEGLNRKVALLELKAHDLMRTG